VNPNSRASLAPGPKRSSETLPRWPEAEARGRKAGYVLAGAEHVYKHVLGLTDFGVVVYETREREK
jgi:hypothetical protein